MRTLVIIALLLTACQNRHQVDPDAERAVICSMLTCGD